MTALHNNDAALKLILKEKAVLEKHLGPGVFVTNEITPWKRISTGITVFDRILGGGFPRGLIVEVTGPESTGKTTLTGTCIAFNQKADPNFRVLYIDFEQTLDRKYFSEGLGVDMEIPRFILTQPTTIEEGTIIATRMMAMGVVDMIVWDTPAASQPAKMLAVDMKEGDLRDLVKMMDAGKSTQEIGLHARAFSYGLSQMVGLAKKSDTLLLFPNQLRTTINTYGAGETTPGGRALKFYASVRMRLSRVEGMKESAEDHYFGSKKGTDVGNLIQCRTIKNKTAPPFRIAEAKLRFGVGFRDVETVFDLAVKRKIIDKSGAYFTLPGVADKQYGTAATLEFLESNPNVFEQLRAALNALDPDEDGYIPVASNVETEEPARDALPTNGMAEARASAAPLEEDDEEVDTTVFADGKVGI